MAADPAQGVAVDIVRRIEPETDAEVVRLLPGRIWTHGTLTVANTGGGETGGETRAKNAVPLYIGCAKPPYFHVKMTDVPLRQPVRRHG
jgi:hypothetical protein